MDEAQILMLMTSLIVIATLAALAFMYRAALQAQQRKAAEPVAEYYPRHYVLVNRQVHAVIRHQRLMLTVAVGVTLLILLALWWLFEPQPGELDGSQLWERLRKNLRANPAEALMFAGFVLIGAFQLLLYFDRKRQRLVLSGTGIEFIPGLLRVPGLFNAPWRLGWNQIQHAVLRPGQLGKGAEFVVLELHTYRQTCRLYPYAWADPASLQAQTLQERLLLGRQSAEQALAMARDSMVIHYLRQAGVEVEIKPGASGTTGFALEKNRATLGLLLIIAALLIYAVVDAVANTEVYAEMPPYPLMLFCGVLAMFAASVWMRRNAVPLAATTGVAAVTGLCFAVACYPGLLRLNQLSDTQGLQPYSYQLQADLSLQPLEEGLPVLRRFMDYPEYWQAQGEASLHQFYLRQGGLEFWQVDAAPFYAATREFYHAQD